MESALHDRLDAAIDRADLIRSCREIVRIPSLTGDEAESAAFTRDLMVHLGFDAVEIDGNGNVIGTIAGHGDGPSVMLNGHLDHVPVGAMEEPFSAKLVEGARWGEPGQAIYGRGSCDMKCNVVSAIHAAAAVKAAGLRPCGDVIVVADVEEETDSPKGVASVVARGVRADYGISVESTRGGVYLGHRGKIELDLVVRGRTSHASEPSNGINAIYEALRYAEAIRAYGDGLPSDDLLGRATVTLTGFHSHPDNGSALVPDEVRIRIDRRYVRGETPQSCEAELRDVVARAAGPDHGDQWSLNLFNHYPLLFTEPDNPVVREAVRALEATTGTTPRLAAWRFGVNGTFMAAAGIPTVGVGPGDEIWAHTPQEHICVDELHMVTRALARLIAGITRARAP